MIWHRAIDLVKLQDSCANTLVAHLGITLVELGDDYLTGTMVVDQRTHQPFGVLHGGASVALAETLGSLAANCCVDLERSYCVGMEINANHLRPVAAGVVTGTARPLHLGAVTQVWEIKIVNADGALVCVSRLTMAVQRNKGRLAGRLGQ